MEILPMKPPAEKGRGVGRRTKAGELDWFNLTRHYGGQQCIF